MKQIPSLLKYLFVVVLSVGWLLPLFLGLGTFLSWAQAEVSPRLAGEVPINSFPFLHFSSDMLALSFVWLAVALAAWTVLSLRRREQASPD